MRDWLTARPIAHRGLHDAGVGTIENTASAFRAAIDGRYAIECDVQISADGEAMVYHDATLGRLTQGEGRLDAMPAAELKRIAFHATADRMQTLGELCDQVAGQATLVVEMKSHFDGDPRLPRRTAAVLSAYSGPVAVMSFDPAQIAVLREAAPDLARGLVAMRRSGGSGREGTPSPARYLMQLLAARLNFLAYRVQDVDSPLPVAARRFLGMPVLTWTVRTPEERARAERFADQMIFEGFRP
jgi:glycerophosphoryl diester phosphodiesterase